MKVTVIFKNKETQQEETSDLFLKHEDIACLYVDRYGTYVTTHQGRSYKVKETLQELKEKL